MGTAFLLFSAVALLPVLVKLVADILDRIGEKQDSEDALRNQPDLRKHIKPV